jgi:hypothetical protein
MIHMTSLLGTLRWAPLAALVVLSGCGGSGLKVPALGKVHGTVTLDGKPLPNAAVSFQPVSGKDGPSQALTDKEGKYTLTYLPGHPGAAIGEHTVRITGKPADAPASVKETVPPKYNEKSELKVAVKEGDNTHDFKLESK